MNNKLVVGLVVLLLGIGAGWYFLGGRKSQYSPATSEKTTAEVSAPATSPAGGQEATSATGAGATGEKMVVKYTESGFAPNILTIKVGTTVTFMNETGSAMWVASAVHPTHQLLPGFDQLKSVGKGGTYDYTFVKVGTWKYHNHMNSGDTGTVVVQ